MILSGLFCIVVGLRQTVAEGAPALFGGARRVRQNKKWHWRAMRRGAVSWSEPGDYPRMVVLEGAAYDHDRSALMRLFSERAQFAVAATDGTSDRWGHETR